MEKSIFQEERKFLTGFAPIVFQVEKDRKIAAVGADFARVQLVPGKESAFVRHDDSTRTLEVDLGGTKDDITRRSLTVLLRKIIFCAKAHRISKLFLSLPDFTFRKVRLREQELAELIAIHFELANFEFVKYKTPPSEGWKVITDVVVVGRATRDIKAGIERGQIIGSEVNACRILANTPGGDMTPQLLAEEAREAVKNIPVDVTVLGKN
ncbi:MAG: hypothetical protein AAB710_02150, partial [Patescibacteria group bacterium]